ncbi:hypothetical protein BR93DRAFT_929295 [Coniochaeta sp. PMI_546]|nr:hypothetical protein BR93DRAFT_929295 [Coniochaeta sp. PMI_546]
MSTVCELLGHLTSAVLYCPSGALVIVISATLEGDRYEKPSNLGTNTHRKGLAC